ncbi:hypothetical protein ACFTZB_44340 [Rhodococcus sp. NPDC057014]
MPSSAVRDGDIPAEICQKVTECCVLSVGHQGVDRTGWKYMQAMRKISKFLEPATVVATITATMLLVNVL